MKKSLLMPALLVVLLFLANACKGGTPTPSDEKISPALTIAIGMPYDEVKKNIKKSGGKNCLCSYGLSLPLGDEVGVNVTWGWYELPNKLVVFIMGRKKEGSDKMEITKISAWNSNSLNYAKSERAYAVTSVKLEGERMTLEGLAGNFIYRGTLSKDAEKALANANSKKLETTAEWLKDFPDGGKWLRYSLPKDEELILNVRKDSASNEVISLVLVEITRKKNEYAPEKRGMIECELVELGAPLTCWDDYDYRDIDDEMFWKPADEE